MHIVPVGELKAHFSKYIKQVQAGEEIVISYGRAGTKVAVLVPFEAHMHNKQPRPIGLLKGRASFNIEENFELSEEEFVGP